MENKAPLALAKNLKGHVFFYRKMDKAIERFSLTRSKRFIDLKFKFEGKIGPPHDYPSDPMTFIVKGFDYPNKNLRDACHQIRLRAGVNAHRLSFFKRRLKGEELYWLGKHDPGSINQENRGEPAVIVDEQGKEILIELLRQKDSVVAEFISPK